MDGGVVDNIPCAVCRTPLSLPAFVTGRHIDTIVEVWVAEELRNGEGGSDLTGWAERNRCVQARELE
jgi:hypothetical protein